MGSLSWDLHLARVIEPEEQPQAVSASNNTKVEIEMVNSLEEIAVQCPLSPARGFAPKCSKSARFRLNSQIYLAQSSSGVKNRPELGFLR